MTVDVMFQENVVGSSRAIYLALKALAQPSCFANLSFRPA